MKNEKEVYTIVLDIASNTAQFWVYKVNAFAEAFNDIAMRDEEEIETLDKHVIETLKECHVVQ
eukprot:scaffold114456_cov24-Attheya_sp.AAC.2